MEGPPRTRSGGCGAQAGGQTHPEDSVSSRAQSRRPGVGSCLSLPRQGNVSSWAIQPTWVPFRTTVFSEEKLVFSLRLMEGEQDGLGGVNCWGGQCSGRLSPPACLAENWSAEKMTPTFQLGDRAHLQAQVHTGSHVPLRLFVDHCVATLTPDWSTSPYHTIVDFHG